jgi:hypothetical protein
MDANRATLADSGAPPADRQRAYDVLESDGPVLSIRERHDLWASGDGTLRHILLPNLYGHPAVAPIAADPSHPWHAAAISALTFGSDEHIALAVAALDHLEPRVRAAAIGACVFPEPIEAIPGLLRCLDDDVEELRVDAADALQYFECREVLTALSEHGDLIARARFESMRDDFAWWVQREPGLAAWVAPVQSLLIGAEPARPDYDPVLTPNTESSVLERSTIDELIIAADAEDDLVSKDAVWALTQREPDRRAAPAARRAMQRWFHGTAWSEAVRAWAQHEDPAVVVPYLVGLARHTRSATERHTAIVELQRLGVADSIVSLLDLLLDPPLVNWGGHIALLDAARQLHLAVDGAILSSLREVDDLHLAIAVARLGAR